MIQQIFGQFFSILAPIFLFLSYQFNKDKTVLLFNLLATISLCVSYLILGATTGFWAMLIGIVRNLLYIFLRDGSIEKFISAGVIAVAVIISGILSWEAWYSIFAMVGLAVNAIFLSLGKIQTLRYSILFSSPCLLAYNVFVFSVGGIINETIGIISAIIGIIRFRKKDEKTNEQPV